MSDNHTGIDRRGQIVLAATTASESGRITIERLQRLEGEPDKNRDWTKSAGVTLAVPDHMAIVKSVRTEAGDESTAGDRLHFELAQSLLESEDNFVFAFQATGDDLRHLGMVLRRETASQLCESFGCDYGSCRDRLSFQLRSVGLGKGYLTFCKQEEGELICLTDLAGSVASICFVHGSNIVDTASLSMTEHDLTSVSGQDRFAIELKTIVNYKQAALMDAGICVPLSSLLFTGDNVNDAFRQAVQTYFPMGVNSPRLHDGFFGGIEDETLESWPLFLVALGLAVN